MKIKNMLFGIKLRMCKSPLKIAELYKKTGIQMGSNCEIFGTAKLGSEPYLIKLGNNVKITSEVEFVNHDGGVYVLRNLKLLENADLFGRITIGNNVFIGHGAIIMPNVNIGNNCVIGAGSIVTKNVEDNSVVAGVPAKKIKSIDEYYQKLKDKVDYTKSMNYHDKKQYLLKKYEGKI